MKTLTDDTIEKVAVFLKSMAEPMRLRILRALQEGEKTVSDIMAEAGASQSNASKHLAVLTQAHILAFRKEGTSIYYKIADPNITEICGTVCRSIAERIRQERAMLKNIEKGAVR